MKTIKDTKAIDFFGDCDYRIINKYGKNETGLLYMSEKRAREEMERLEIKNCTIEHRDTRPTIGAILKAIKEAEGEVWEEYLSCSYNEKGYTTNDKWPCSYRWVSVYVVTGGSEGMYLHVDIITNDNERKHIITGKTLNGNHEENLWLSAGRIAKMLQA